MNSVKFKLVMHSENVMALVLHWKFRLFFAALSILLIAILFLDLPNGTLFLYSFLAIGCCIGGIFFHETWIFDRDAKVILRNKGLLFYFTTLRIETDQIDSIHIDIPNKHGYREGMPKTERLIQSKYFKLYIVLTNRKRHHIETMPLSSLYLLEDHAAQLSDFISCPLTTDVPDITIQPDITNQIQQ